jgi:hypothetical protein
MEKTKRALFEAWKELTPPAGETLLKVAAKLRPVF